MVNKNANNVIAVGKKKRLTIPFIEMNSFVALSAVHRVQKLNKIIPN
jgi:hypothetical protein